MEEEVSGGRRGKWWEKREEKEEEASDGRRGNEWKEREEVK